ncbi:hypothetical protein A8W25_01820 [Streptomyces sp. ERV7]|uniref:hypothetical protein n=1 Tax=Streptomyces sp. ERV7 TaxID=1322334 RepID=UPI0007F3AF74|nr:hypothetical protein [Streptomyces sp. ERV7]OAR27040.1 hypothetical protein A8W25_01820 [Streptomyces sp. ERV7]
MDGQWAVVVGAALGAGGAIAGALTTWSSARVSARGQLDVARLQLVSQQEAETVVRKRAAYADLILSVDTVRRQMRIVRRHVQTPRGTDDDLEAKRAAVHDRIRETQAAEWVLRLMLAEDEQAAVTHLIDAIYTCHLALIEDVDEWLARGETDGRREPADTPRYAATTGALQAQMLAFAGKVHERLYRPAGITTGQTVRRWWRNPLAPPPRP